MCRIMSNLFCSVKNNSVDLSCWIFFVKLKSFLHLNGINGIHAAGQKTKPGVISVLLILCKGSLALHGELI